MKPQPHSPPHVHLTTELEAAIRRMICAHESAFERRCDSQSDYCANLCDASAIEALEWVLQQASQLG